ncbi:hypothetical protein AB0903_04885 [Streptomyces sp. NPDC048389]|uniref:hypothetical protein n=1 Tax=Streptomyces sp. NPDC048389 TaxID=3154622 RepID=UPI0034558ADB
MKGFFAHLHSRGRRPVLLWVDLALSAKACVGVAGLSGPVKTPLSRCVAGLHERRRGRVLLDGVVLAVLRRCTTEQKRRVRYVRAKARAAATNGIRWSSR